MSEELTPKPEEEAENPFGAFDENVRTVKEEKKHRLSRRTRILLAAVAVVVLLAGALTLVWILPRHLEPAESSDTPQEVFPLFDYSNGKSETEIVKAISIENQTGRFTVRYQEKIKNYELEGYEDLTLGAAVSTLAENAIGISGTARVKDASDLAGFGLAQPAARVVISYFEHPDMTLLIGSAAPSGVGYYVKTADSADVYIVDAETAEYFLKAAADFVDVTLMTPPTPKSDDAKGSTVLKALSLTGSDHPTPLTIRRYLSSDDPDYSLFEYVTATPYFRGVKDTVGQTLSSFISLLAARTAVLHPTDAQKAEVGLDAPSNVLNVTLAVETLKESDSSDEAETPDSIYYNEVSTVLTLGNRDDDGNYYATVNGINAIFVVDSASVQGIANLTYESVISDLLFIKDITALKAVDIRENGVLHRFALAHHPEKEEPNDQLTVTYGGKQYDTADFRLLYQWMMGLVRYGKAEVTPTGTPEMEITIYKNDASKLMGFAFYQTSGSLYTVRALDGELFTVKAGSVVDLMKQIDLYRTEKPVEQP